MRYLVSFLVTTISTPLLLFAQVDEEKAVHFYNIRTHYGSMIIHSRDLRDIGNAYPAGVEFSLAQQSVGSRAWESCNCYPKKGVTLGLWYFDKPEVLGNGYSAHYFIEPVFNAWNRLYFSFKAAAGVAYLTKPYDSIENPYNLSYSTRISFPLHIGMLANYRFNKNIDVGLGLIYNHISNGGLREPNKGINWPTINLGIDYKPHHYIPRQRERIEYNNTDDSKINSTISLFVTAKQLNHTELKKYVIAGFSAEANSRVSKLSILAAGIDIELDYSDREEIIRSDFTSTDHKKGGLFAGHQFLLGRFTFSQSIGVYLYAPYNLNDPVYQNYALMYKAGNRINLGIRLKAHRHVADYLAVQAGYSFF